MKCYECKNKIATSAIHFKNIYFVVCEDCKDIVNERIMKNAKPKKEMENELA